jgi:hypothetical protein
VDGDGIVKLDTHLATAAEDGGGIDKPGKAAGSISSGRRRDR